MALNTLLTYVPLYIKTSRESLKTLLENVDLLVSSDLEAKKKAEFEAYRMAHTLKSSSLFMDYKHISAMMVLLERYFSLVKDGGITISQAAIDSIHEVVKQSEADLRSIERENKEIDLANQINTLKQLVSPT